MPALERRCQRSVSTPLTATITDLFDDTGASKNLNPLDSVFAFAGREWDNDAGRYYNRARWLDPKIGRFISEDPLGFEGGDSNLYRYANNNPFNLTDSTGLSWLSDLFDDVGDFFEGLFNNVKNFVNNTDKIFPALIEDPLFWASLIVQPIFAVNVTWGAFSFDVGLGLGGNLFAGPNYLEMGRNAFNALGSAFTQSINVAAFLPQPQSGFNAGSLASQSGILPVQYLEDAGGALSSPEEYLAFIHKSQLVNTGPRGQP